MEASITSTSAPIFSSCGESFNFSCEAINALVAVCHYQLLKVINFRFDAHSISTELSNDLLLMRLFASL